MPSLPSLVHPRTHRPLSRISKAYRCDSTQELFPDQQGVPCTLPTAQRSVEEEDRSDLENSIKTFLRRVPWVYRALIFWISPVCYVGMTAKGYLRRFGKDAKILNVGSGIHRYTKEMINLDSYPYAEVDIVADATALPFADNTFDGMLAECLLEHVPTPDAVVREMLRCLKPGGTCYITVPFVYHFHGCPGDYYRWTRTGLLALCEQTGAEVEAVESRSGPTSALVSTLVTWLSVVLSFGSHKLYSLWAMVLLIPLAPLKFLDHIVGRYSTAVYGTEGFYLVIRKQEESKDSDDADDSDEDQ